MGRCVCSRAFCGWTLLPGEISGAAALALLAILLLALFAVDTLGAEEEDRVFHGISVEELASARPGSEIPTHVDVAGYVALVKREKDGDRHIRLCESPSCSWSPDVLPEHPEIQHRHPWVIAECIPELAGPCEKARKGRYVRVRGISRWDGHHQWAEIHPVESLEVLP